MNVEEVRSKTDAEIEFDLEHVKKELFELRFRGATQSVANPSRIKELRRSIARMNTVLHERSKGIRGQEKR